MSTTVLVVIFGAIFYQLHVISKRLEKLEDKQGSGYTWQFSVDATNAVLSNKFFGALSGIKSAEEGKQFKDWSNSDRKTWHDKYRDLISNKCFVHITYLVSDDCFFIKNQATSGIALKDLGKTLLYSEVIIGDPDMIGDYLSFNIYERLMKKDNKYQRVITLCLEERFEDFDKKEKVHILLDFPYQRTDLTDEELSTLGFKVDRREGDYVGTDMFGDHFSIPDRTTLRKNFAEVSF